MLALMDTPLPTLSQYLSHRPSEYVSLVQVDEEELRVSKDFTASEILSLIEKDPTKKMLKEAVLSPFGILPEDLCKFTQIFGMATPSTKSYTNDLNSLANGVKVMEIYKPFKLVSLHKDKIQEYSLELASQALGILLKAKSSWGLALIETSGIYNIPTRATYQAPILATKTFYKLLLNLPIDFLTELRPCLRVYSPSLTEITTLSPKGHLSQLQITAS